MLKNLPAMWEASVWFLRWEDPQEKGKATHTSFGLENSIECIVHGVAKSRTQLRNFYNNLQGLRDLFRTLNKMVT